MAAAHRLILSSRERSIDVPLRHPGPSPAIIRPMSEGAGDRNTLNAAEIEIARRIVRRPADRRRRRAAMPARRLDNIAYRALPAHRLSNVATSSSGIGNAGNARSFRRPVRHQIPGKNRSRSRPRPISSQRARPMRPGAPMRPTGAISPPGAQITARKSFRRRRRPSPPILVRLRARAPRCRPCGGAAPRSAMRTGAPTSITRRATPA